MLISRRCQSSNKCYWTQKRFTQSTKDLVRSLRQGSRYGAIVQIFIKRVTETRNILISMNNEIQTKTWEVRNLNWKLNNMTKFSFRDSKNLKISFMSILRKKLAKKIKEDKDLNLGLFVTKIINLLRSEKTSIKKRRSRMIRHGKNNNKKTQGFWTSDRWILSFHSEWNYNSKRGKTNPKLLCKIIPF